MKKVFIYISFLFFSVSIAHSQVNTTTRQIRFQTIGSASDTAATSANNGRMWFDFSTQQFRGIKNATAFSIGSGGGLTTASNGLTKVGSDVKLGGTLTENTSFNQAGFNTTFTGTGKVTFSPSLTLAGLNVGVLSGDPSTPANGDIWYDNNILTLDNRLRARVGNTSVSLISNTGSQSLLNKTLSTGTTFSVTPSINSGVKFTFSPSATLAGINTGSVASSPSSLTNGDIWYNSTTGTLGAYLSGQVNRMIGTVAAGLTPGRIPFTAGGSTAILVDDSDLSFSTDRLTATNLTVATDLQASYLTSGRVPYVTTSGTITDNSNLTWDNTNQRFTVTGSSRANGIFPFQAISTSDAYEFVVDWVNSSVSNGGTLTQGIDIFLSDAAIELEDKSAMVEYNVLLTKADGSDNQIKRILVGYRKDGAANPVQTGSATELFSVGNTTPTVSFSISVGGLPQIVINDNTSGGWKVKVWAKVTRSN